MGVNVDIGGYLERRKKFEKKAHLKEKSYTCVSWKEGERVSSSE